MFVSGVGLTNQWTLIKQLVHVQRCYIYVVNLMAPDMYKQCETQIQEMCDGESGRHKTAEEGEKREGAQRWGGGGDMITVVVTGVTHLSCCWKCWLCVRGSRSQSERRVGSQGGSSGTAGQATRGSAAPEVTWTR